MSVYVYLPFVENKQKKLFCKKIHYKYNKHSQDNYDNPYNARNTPASYIIIQRLSSVSSIFSHIFSHTIFPFAENRQQNLFYFTWQTRYFIVFLRCIISPRCLQTSFSNALDVNPGAAEQSFRDIFEHIEKRVSCNIIVNYTIAYDIKNTES